MEYRQLGKTDLQISSIGLGCGTFSREIDEAASFTVMDRAFERGITLFDTAEDYNSGGSETVVGRWLADRGTRDEIVLATKVRTNLTRKRVIASAEASLRRLQTETIDLFQVHDRDGDVPLAETLEALNTLVEEGKVRHIGCSNYDAWQLCKALWQADVNGWTRMESVQPPYSLVTRDIEREMLPLCADQAVGVISYSPLGAGFLTGKYGRDGGIPTHPLRHQARASRRLFSRRKLARHGSPAAKSAEMGASMVHLALAWVTGQPGITRTCRRCSGLRR